jgi:hypothetical protein
MDNNNNNDSDSDLDDAWIQEFEEQDLPYIDFYKDTVEDIKLCIIYIDKNNKIFHVKHSDFKINNQILPKSSLIFLLKRFMIYNDRKFHPLSILKYNIDLDPSDVTRYIDYNNEQLTACSETLPEFQFLCEINTISDIYWEDTISMYKHLNSLYLIFYEKSPRKKINQTKKIKINHKKNQKYTRRR